MPESWDQQVAQLAAAQDTDREAELSRALRTALELWDDFVVGLAIGATTETNLDAFMHGVGEGLREFVPQFNGLWAVIGGRGVSEPVATAGDAP